LRLGFISCILGGAPLMRDVRKNESDPFPTICMAPVQCWFVRSAHRLAHLDVADRSVMVAGAKNHKSARRTFALVVLLGRVSVVLARPLVFGGNALANIAILFTCCSRHGCFVLWLWIDAPFTLRSMKGSSYDFESPIIVTFFTFFSSRAKPRSHRDGMIIARGKRVRERSPE
jgi:hypothetical protein